jgi:hypothetical protein
VQVTHTKLAGAIKDARHLVQLITQEHAASPKAEEIVARQTGQLAGLIPYAEAAQKGYGKRGATDAGVLRDLNLAIDKARTAHNKRMARIEARREKAKLPKLSEAQWKALEAFAGAEGHRHGPRSGIGDRTANKLANRRLVALGVRKVGRRETPWGVATLEGFEALARRTAQESKGRTTWAEELAKIQPAERPAWVLEIIEAAPFREEMMLKWGRIIGARATKPPPPGTFVLGSYVTAPGRTIEGDPGGPYGVVVELLNGSAAVRFPQTGAEKDRQTYQLADLELSEEQQPFAAWTARDLKLKPKRKRKAKPKAAPKVKAAPKTPEPTPEQAAMLALYAELKPGDYVELTMTGGRTWRGTVEKRIGHIQLIGPGGRISSLVEFAARPDRPRVLHFFEKGYSLEASERGRLVVGLALVDRLKPKPADREPGTGWGTDDPPALQFETVSLGDAIHIATDARGVQWHGIVETLSKTGATLRDDRGQTAKLARKGDAFTLTPEGLKPENVLRIVHFFEGFGDEEKPSKKIPGYASPNTNPGAAPQLAGFAVGDHVVLLEDLMGPTGEPKKGDEARISSLGHDRGTIDIVPWRRGNWATWVKPHQIDKIHRKKRMHVPTPKRAKGNWVRGDWVKLKVDQGDFPAGTLGQVRYAGATYAAVGVPDIHHDEGQPSARIDELAKAKPPKAQRGDVRILERFDELRPGQRVVIRTLRVPRWSGWVRKHTAASVELNNARTGMTSHLSSTLKGPKKKRVLLFHDWAFGRPEEAKRAQLVTGLEVHEPTLPEPDDDDDEPPPKPAPPKPAPKPKPAPPKPAPPKPAPKPGEIKAWLPTVFESEMNAHGVAYAGQSKGDRALYVANAKQWAAARAELVEELPKAYDEEDRALVQATIDGIDKAVETKTARRQKPPAPAPAPAIAPGAQTVEAFEPKLAGKPLRLTLDRSWADLGDDMGLRVTKANGSRSLFVGTPEQFTDLQVELLRIAGESFTDEDEQAALSASHRIAARAASLPPSTSGAAASPAGSRWGSPSLWAITASVATVAPWSAQTRRCGRASRPAGKPKSWRPEPPALRHRQRSAPTIRTRPCRLPRRSDGSRPTASIGSR